MGSEMCIRDRLEWTVWLLVVITRGKSGLQRVEWWITSTEGDLRESATESKPPLKVRVKRCGKSAPAVWVTKSAL